MIDVYHGTGNIDWNRVAAAGNGAAFCKSTEGLATIDSTLQRNLAGMAEAGMRRGVYHFAHLEADASLQAQHCLNAALAAGYDFAADMPVALDLEPNPANPGVEDRLGKDHIRAFVTNFSRSVQETTGKLPILYGSKDFLDTYLGDGFGGHPLWLAHYAETMGPLPVGWTTWHIWQYDEFGTVDGVSGTGNVDMDRWNPENGDISEWQVGGAG